MTLQVGKVYGVKAKTGLGADLSGIRRVKLLALGTNCGVSTIGDRFAPKVNNQTVNGRCLVEVIEGSGHAAHHVSIIDGRHCLQPTVLRPGTQFIMHTTALSDITNERYEDDMIDASKFGKPGYKAVAPPPAPRPAIPAAPKPIIFSPATSQNRMAPPPVAPEPTRLSPSVEHAQATRVPIVEEARSPARPEPWIPRADPAPQRVTAGRPQVGHPKLDGFLGDIRLPVQDDLFGILALLQR